MARRVVLFVAVTMLAFGVGITQQLCARQAADALESPRAILIERNDLRGELTALDSSSVSLGQAGTQVDIALEDFVMWGNPVDAPTFERIHATDSARLVLTNGSVLTADLISANTDDLVVESRLRGQQKIPLAHVAAVLISPPSNPAIADELIEGLLRERPNADQLTLSNGDAVRGTLTEINIAGAESTFGMETEAGRISFEAANVRALTFDPRFLNTPSQPAKFRVGLSEGSLIHAEELSIKDDRATMVPFAGASWEVSASRIVYVEYSNPQVKWLEDREPDQFQHVPFLTGEWSWQAGKNALGEALHVAGVRYLHGVGVHSASQMTYVLREPALRFEAEIALDDAAEHLGNVVFRGVTYARVDGQTVRTEKFVSPTMRAGDAPLAVSIDLSEAVGLGLIVDFGESGDQKDFANWLNARLIFAEE